MGALEQLPVPVPAEFMGTESCLQETGFMLQKYALLYQHFLCHCVYEDCTKNMIYLNFFNAFLSLIWASESVWRWGKFWMSFSATRSVILI